MTSPGLVIAGRRAGSGAAEAGGRPRGRIGPARPGSRPASASARRSRNSIWAFVLRSSSLAYLGLLGEGVVDGGVQPQQDALAFGHRGFRACRHGRWRRADMRRARRLAGTRARRVNPARRGLGGHARNGPVRHHLRRLHGVVHRPDPGAVVRRWPAPRPRRAGVLRYVRPAPAGAHRDHGAIRVAGASAGAEVPGRGRGSDPGLLPGRLCGHAGPWHVQGTVTHLPGRPR